MKINLQELKEKLTKEQIIKLVLGLGADRYEERENFIIFPTICHNPIGADASMKLYYYIESCTFHCYTECSENFDIFDLFRKVKEVNGEDFNFYETIYVIADLVEYNFFSATTQESYISNTDKFKTNNEIELQKYNKGILNVFREYYTVEWLDEGISARAMKKFNILYYDYRNKIIIPHYDIEGNLIGIRGRSLDLEEIEKYGKYAPIRVENTLYRHPLSFNLYGLYENQENIKKYRTAIIFEGEKSVYKYDDMYDVNIAVASCGSSLNYHQVEILVKDLNVENIIIAYDKEYDNFASEEAIKYYNKLQKICEKYSNYCSFSFLFDFDNLLSKKDAPIDKGKEVFEKLLRNKIQVRLNNDL